MNKNEIEKYVKAGKIAKEILAFIHEFVKKDMLLIEIAEKIELKIKELGGDIAFPVNLSINEIAAHYTPSSTDKIKASGLLKIDLGVDIEGYIADCAISLDLTEDKRFQKMIELNEKALENAIDKIHPGVRVSDVGDAIFETIKHSKFSTINNLSGHSLDQYVIHAGLTVPNYRNNNFNELNNIAIAIEPFLTEGDGRVFDSSNSEIFMLERSGSIRDRDARELLQFIIENYKTKPFCKRWLEKQTQLKKLNFSLSLLVKEKILHNFPVLVEKSRKPVSQVEHTVLILKDKVIVTTK